MEQVDVPTPVVRDVCDNGGRPEEFAAGRSLPVSCG